MNVAKEHIHGRFRIEKCVLCGADDARTLKHGQKWIPKPIARKDSAVRNDMSLILTKAGYDLVKDGVLRVSNGCRITLVLRPLRPVIPIFVSDLRPLPAKRGSEKVVAIEPGSMLRKHLRRSGLATTTEADKKNQECQSGPPSAAAISDAQNAPLSCGHGPPRDHTPRTARAVSFSDEFGLPFATTLRRLRCL